MIIAIKNKELIEKLQVFNPEAFVQVVVLDKSKPKEPLFGENIARFLCTHDQSSGLSTPEEIEDAKRTCFSVLLVVERG